MLLVGLEVASSSSSSSTSKNDNNFVLWHPRRPANEEKINHFIRTDSREVRAAVWNVEDFLGKPLAAMLRPSSSVARNEFVIECLLVVGDPAFAVIPLLMHTNAVGLLCHQHSARRKRADQGMYHQTAQACDLH